MARTSEREAIEPLSLLRGQTGKVFCVASAVNVGSIAKAPVPADVAKTLGEKMKRSHSALAALFLAFAANANAAGFRLDCQANENGTVRQFRFFINEATREVEMAYPEDRSRFAFAKPNAVRTRDIWFGIFDRRSGRPTERVDIDRRTGDMVISSTDHRRDKIHGKCVKS